MDFPLRGPALPQYYRDWITLNISKNTCAFIRSPNVYTPLEVAQQFDRCRRFEFIDLVPASEVHLPNASRGLELLRMVGDSHISISALFAGFGHLLDRAGTIAPGRKHVSDKSGVGCSFVCVLKRRFILQKRREFL
jgi:hypothetical protein